MKWSAILLPPTKMIWKFNLVCIWCTLIKLCSLTEANRDVMHGLPVKKSRSGTVVITQSPKSGIPRPLYIYIRKKLTAKSCYYSCYPKKMILYYHYFFEEMNHECINNKWMRLNKIIPFLHVQVLIWCSFAS